MAVELEPQDVSNLSLPLGQHAWLKDFLLPPDVVKKNAPPPAIKPTPGVKVTVDKAAPPPAAAFQPGGATVPHVKATKVPGDSSILPPSFTKAVASAEAPAQQVDPIQAQLQDPETRTLLAETMVGEGNSPQMQQAIMQIVFNRARMSGQSIKDVINAEGQFDSMDYGTAGGRRTQLDAEGKANDPRIQAALGIIDKPNPAWRIAPNITHNFAPDAEVAMQKKDPAHYKGRPDWAPGIENVKGAFKIGNTEFYPGDYKGGKAQAAPDGGQGDTSDDAWMAEALRYLTPTPEQLTRIAEDQKISYDAFKQGMLNFGPLSEMYKQEMAGIDADRKGIEESWTRYRESTDALLKNWPDRQKMEQEELLKISNSPRDPSRVLGQFLPMLAILGGAFTRAGAIGSLKAAGAAMSAAREHDDAALKRADEQYRDAINDTLQKATLVHQELSEGIEARKDDMLALQQYATVKAAELNLPFMAAAAANNDAKGIMEVPTMIGHAIAEVGTMRKQQLDARLADVHYRTAIANLNSGGMPHIYQDTQTGQMVYYHPKAPPGQKWTDGDDNPIPTPQHFTQVTSGRQYGGVQGYVQAAVNANGGVPLNLQQLGQVLSRYYEMVRHVQRFQGPLGDKILAFNNALAHLGVLEQLSHHLAPTDLPIFNAIAQKLAVETGQPQPTNFQGALNIVGDEVVKAIVPTNATQSERDSAKATFLAQFSSGQMQGAIDTTRALMSTQLENIRQSYYSTPGQEPFNRFLTPEAIGMITPDTINPDWDPNANALPFTPTPGSAAAGQGAGGYGQQAKQPFLEGQRKQDFRDTVYQTINDVAQGNHAAYKSEAWVRATLKGMFKDAPDAEIDQAVTAIMAAKLGPGLTLKTKAAQ